MVSAFSTVGRFGARNFFDDLTHNVYALESKIGYDKSGLQHRILDDFSIEVRGIRER